MNENEEIEVQSSCFDLTFLAVDDEDFKTVVIKAVNHADEVMTMVVRLEDLRTLVERSQDALEVE